MTTHSPDANEIGRALAAGIPRFRDVPVRVERPDGWAVLDLVQVLRGNPDPWHVARIENGVVFRHDPQGDSGVFVAGLRVATRDRRAVIAALEEAPTEQDRHCPEGEARRLRAGTIAMTISDAMVRARTLDAVDGWSAVMGRVVDDDPKHGRLCEPADPELLCRMLRVVCPSTGRAYVHRVPREYQTAATARGMLMRGWWPDGDVGGCET